MTALEGSDFTLDEQLCFAIYSASRAMTAAYRVGLAPLALTYTQYAVLLQLWEDDVVTMGLLSDRLHLDSATLSPVLKRLAAMGLVERRRSRADERVLDVHCTAAGHALRDRVRAVQVEVEQATGLAPDELATMREDLHRLARLLRDYGQDARQQTPRKQIS